ncbi:MAG: alanine racemase [Treponema sp.]|jgi:alanine racemase|nr:alanine racemase [Treponema sp.]
MRATRAIVHLDRFLGNFKAIQERIGPRHICVPVKADAYGHGAADIARQSLAAGAFCLGVAGVQEGAELRNGGISAPILVFSQSLPSEIPEIIKNGLSPLVSDGDFIEMLAKTASEAGIRLPVHLKIDTGMGRVGCAPSSASSLAKKIAASNALEYAGTATHLAVSDSTTPEDRAYTEQQIARFREALDQIRGAGVDPGIVHAANSGAIALHPDAWFDMVRPGIILYGYNLTGTPSPKVEPVMELRTNVALIKLIKKGETISYGRTWTSPHDTAIAVLPVGYADGLPRLVSNKWQVVIGGKTYPLVGRICMDQCMTDLGPGSNVQRWDEVSIFGGPAPSAAVLAEIIGTIPYEITCNINKRVPRVYEQVTDNR